MKNTFFVTGTDTDAGKTFVSTALLHCANDLGLKTLALKPVASGCEEGPDGLRNDDALRLMAAMSCELDYEQVNPYAFAPAIAPHIAAKQADKNIKVSRLAGFCRGAMFAPYQFGLIEGAGGWRVPLNEREDYSGLAKELNVPVVLVVGLKLGCINHALLSAEAIAADGLRLAGWVANQIDEDIDVLEENVATLKHRLPAPCLGFIPYLKDKDARSACQYLDVSALTS